MARVNVDWPSFLQVKPIIQWPGAQTPVGRRRSSTFRAGFGATVTLLRKELEHLTELGNRRAILQMALTDRDIRLDGYPRADANPLHPGVIVSIESKHGPLSYPCDTFDDWQDNLRGIALGLQALRAVDRYGITPNGEQYAGFKQLGAGPTMTQIEAAILLASVGYPETTELGRKEMSRGVLTDSSVRAMVWRQVVKNLHVDGVVNDRTLWEQVNEAKRLVS